MTKHVTNRKLKEYQKEYKDWLDVLSHYHTGRFKANYAQYSTQTATRGTKTRISDPVSPELIERVIQKLFEKDPKFYALSKGKNVPKEVTDIMSSIAEYYWTDPDVVQASGIRNATLNLIGREFCITGNAGTETFYNVKADCPDFRVVPIEDIIFDPAKTLKTSDVYYIRQFVSLDWLKENAEVKEDGVSSGLFKNIKKLEREIKTEEELNKKTTDNSSNKIERTKDSSQHRVDEIELISRWEGPELVQWTPKLPDEVLREASDPLSIGDDPLDLVMDIEIVKEPYGTSFLDWLSGLTHAKDLILNQAVDYGAKALNPPLYVDPNISPVNRASLRNANKLGGIVFVPPQQADHKAMPPFPSIGFDMLGYIQQRAESVTALGPYTSGVPNQESDKTQGTKGGIEALQAAGISPIAIRQRNLEESIIEPVINKWLKMAGALMGENEAKYVFISGEDQKWIRVTKGLLTGKITLDDLYQAEIVEDEEASMISAEMMERGEDPETDLVFDIDWIIRVEAGSMAEMDVQKEVQNLQSVISTGMELGLPLNTEKIWKDIARKSGMKEPEQYLLTPEEQQQQMQELQQQQMGVPQEGATHVMPDGTVMPGATHEETQGQQAQQPIQVPDNPFEGV